MTHQELQTALSDILSTPDVKAKDSKLMRLKAKLTNEEMTKPYRVKFRE